jgi:5-methylcytosine-specific restriction enzyme subunit McrC
MHSARTIQVFEHERLTIRDNNRDAKLTKVELDALLSFNDSNNNQYFDPIRDGVKFKSFVGVIQVGSLTLEILPKADRTNYRSVTDYAVWRGALLSMLKICKKVSVDTVTEAKLKRRRLSLLDLYFQMYLDELTQLIHEGLFKRYKPNTDNIQVWKGRINFSQHIQKNIIAKDKFYTTHQTYSKDHLVNQILKKGLRIISAISNKVDIKDRANQLLSYFGQVSDINITEKSFERINPSRKLRSFQSALKIAHIIILNYSPDIKSGGTKLLALLFDMNHLWEEYLYRMLLRVETDDYDFSAQESKLFWESKRVRPDIVLKKKSTRETYIIDAKWKIIDASKPSDADLKQMYVYNLYWDATKSMLLYPSSSVVKEQFGHFHQGRIGQNSCKLGFLKVLDEDGNLDQNVGQRIVSKLED